MVRFLCWSSWKHNFTVLLKERTVIELLHLQNPYFEFFCNCAKNARRDNNNLKTKGRHVWKQHKKISFKKVSNLCRELLVLPKINFPLNWQFCFMFPQVKTHFSLSQNNFFKVTTYSIWQFPNYEKLESLKTTHPSIDCVHCAKLPR